MGNIFIFGRMCELVGCPLRIDLVDCSSCRWTNACRCLIYFSWGGVWMVRRGSGGGGCLCGRRSMWGTLFITSKYEFVGWQGGQMDLEFWKNLTLTIFVVLTNFKLLMLLLLLWWVWRWYGRRISLWRLWFLLGVCFRIDFQPKITCFGVVL